MILSEFRGAQSETVNLEVVFDSIDHLVTFIPRQNTREEFHDPRIRVQTSKWFPVGFPPAPQNQPVCRYRDHEISLAMIPTRPGLKKPERLPMACRRLELS